MAKQRIVNTKFWDDTFVADLDPIEKLMFLYLLTNPLTDLCGAYEVTLKRIAFDTGIDREMVLKIFGRFETAGKIFYKDGWVVVRNFAKHQVSNPKVSKGIERSLSTCPDWVKAKLDIDYDSLSKPITPEPKLLPEPLPKPEPSGKEATAKPEPKILCPINYDPTEEMLKWAKVECPSVTHIEDETEEFVTFWRDIATKNNKRTIRGWHQTWKTRMKELQLKYGNSNGFSKPKVDMSIGARNPTAALAVSDPPDEGFCPFCHREGGLCHEHGREAA